VGFWLVNCFDKASKNKSMRCWVRPKSAMEVIVVTVVSAVAVSRVVFLFTGAASIVSVELYDRKLGFVLALAWCVLLSISSMFHCRLATALGRAFQIWAME